MVKCPTCVVEEFLIHVVFFLIVHSMYCEPDEHVGTGGTWADGAGECDRTEGNDSDSDNDDDALSTDMTLLSLGADPAPLAEATANLPALTLFYDYKL